MIVTVPFALVFCFCRNSLYPEQVSGNFPRNAALGAVRGLKSFNVISFPKISTA